MLLVFDELGRLEASEVATWEVRVACSSKRDLDELIAALQTESARVEDWTLPQGVERGSDARWASERRVLVAARRAPFDAVVLWQALGDGRELRTMRERKVRP